jgi:hypothetical protein
MAYFLAVVVAYLVASAMATLEVMLTLSGFGLTPSVQDILASIWMDWLGMIGSYLPLIALAMAIALPVASRLRRWLGGEALPWYLAAGFVAFVVLHLIMEATLGLVGFASARSISGLLLQGLAGGVAGWCFSRVRVARP